MSSSRKKLKVEHSPNTLKRHGNEQEFAGIKRAKVEKENDVRTWKRKNFVAACEQVSYKEYCNFENRLQLIYLPACLNEKKCCHQDDNQVYVKEIPNNIEERIKTELNTNMWCEALEVCQLCISHEQYLSAAVLKEIVEIIMNVHEDNFFGYTADDVIKQARQILTLNFSAHPPCNNGLKKLYKTLLTSPMGLKKNTFTNRSDFQCDKGIVIYCMNRLEYEINLDSKDEPLVDKCQNIPEDMKQGVKGVYWQKEKFEIFEVLARPERIRRIMAVLDTIVELLQFDLALWYSRYTTGLEKHLVRSHKPLMAYILMSDVSHTNGVSNICRQFLQLFSYMVHLRYPEDHIRIMTTWLNIIIQTYYICESHSNSDYPNTARYCIAFAKEFCKIIADLPNKTVIQILNTIQPSFMVNLIGTLYIQTLLNTQEENILKIFLNFINKKKWKDFLENDTDIEIPKKSIIKPKKVKDVLKYLTKACETITLSESKECVEDNIYRKFDHNAIENDPEITLHEIVLILYITMEAFLDAHSVQLVQDKIENLNERLTEMAGDVTNKSTISEHCSYSVTEHFIKRYRTIFQVSTELVSKLYKLKESNELPPCVLKISNALGFIE
ncbi:uncharacterized protein LOC113236924 [Hyposmocoma kahamanoa]|uniref:uncharacterized protein LOC113236924 n=1 Tax=Hyposmocoma kahamanoa TaxID=1477025 RepID=UPI000E6D68FD|nr:uncharacterized protein LOC113236924 [Hyposmocoma kahamanoa]